MALAKARAQEKRAEFVAETYTPLELHMFVPSGFVHYTLQRDEYDSELVLRDPAVHLSMTWTLVYLQTCFSFHLNLNQLRMPCC